MVSGDAPRIVIIGGGFSGTLTAVQLVRKSSQPLNITILETREEVGRGLAYSTPNEDHLLNVRASGMSAFPDDSDHFLRFAQSQNPEVTPDTFVSRKFYGQYIQSLLNDARSEAASNGTEIHLVRGEAIDIVEQTHSKSHQVVLKNGNALEADYVVFATGNLLLKPPALFSKAADRYIHNPWHPGVMEAIKTDEKILIIGTGLTAVDKIIDLQNSAHHGSITAVSRHGRLPQEHIPQADSMPAEAPPSVPQTARETLALIRNAARESGDWRRAVDSMRSVTQSWWSELPPVERRRVSRHLQSLWDIHRHRMAPHIAQRIRDLRESGALRIQHGKIRSIDMREDERIAVRLRDGELLIVDRIINCTGFGGPIEHWDSTLYQNLVKRGTVTSRDAKNGFAVDCNLGLSTASGAHNLFMLGPNLKTKLFESVAVPELKVQAEIIATEIVSRVLAHEAAQLTLPTGNSATVTRIL